MPSAESDQQVEKYVRWGDKALGWGLIVAMPISVPIALYCGLKLRGERNDVAREYILQAVAVLVLWVAFLIFVLPYWPGPL